MAIVNDIEVSKDKAETIINEKIEQLKQEREELKEKGIKVNDYFVNYLDGNYHRFVGIRTKKTIDSIEDIYNNYYDYLKGLNPVVISAYYLNNDKRLD